MAGDDEIVVEIENEAPNPAERPEVVVLDETGTVQKPAPKAAKQDDDIVSSLKSQLEAKQTELATATQRVTSAESVASQAQLRAARAERDADTARTQAHEHTKATIDSGIAAAKAEADAAQQAYEVAFESGNAKETAKAQRRLARAEAELVTLEQAKSDIGDKPVKRVSTQEPKPQ